MRGQTESWYLKEYNGTNPTRHTNPPSVNKLIDASLVSKFQIIHIQQGSIDSLKGKTLIITDVFHSLTYSNHKPYSQCRGRSSNFKKILEINIIQIFVTTLHFLIKISYFSLINYHNTHLLIFAISNPSPT